MIAPRTEIFQGMFDTINGSTPRIVQAKQFSVLTEISQKIIYVKIHS